MERRLRGGKSLVADAPRAFADPSASIDRWIYSVFGTAIPDGASLARNTGGMHLRALVHESCRDDFFTDSGEYSLFSVGPLCGGRGGLN